MFTKLSQNSLPKLVLQIIAFVVGLAVVYWLRHQILAILVPVLIAVAIAYILNPVANWLELRIRQRTVAVLLLFIAFFGLVLAILAGILPLFAEQVDSFVQQIPLLIQRGQNLLKDVYGLAARLNLPSSIPDALEKGLRGMEERLLAYLARIPEATVNVAKGLFTFTLVLVLSFYFLRDFDLIRDSLYCIIPRRYRPGARKTIQEIDSNLGKYIRGQLLLALVVGVLTYVSLLVLGVEFSLLWGIFAGLTNTIPYFGPFLGAAPAVFVALLTSPGLALKTVLVFVIIQQVECNFISPYILGKTLGLHPLVVFLALLAGGQFLGVWGLVIAVPVVVAAKIIIANAMLPPLDKRSPKGSGKS